MMIFSEIKQQLIENEEGENEAYLQDLEECSEIHQLLQVVSDYRETDEYEAAYIILTKVSQ